MTKSLRKEFTRYFIVTAIVLSLCGSALVWVLFNAQKKQAVELQTEVGKRATNEFIILTHELEDRLTLLSKLHDLLNLAPAQQATQLSKTRSYKDDAHNDIIDEIILFNNEGTIVSSASRINLLPDKKNYSWSDFKKEYSSSPIKGPHYTPIRIDENGEPFTIVTIALENFQTGELKGALAARLRINLVWENIVRMPVGRSGIIYITDQEGRIISHPNPSVVFKGVIPETSSNNFPTGLKGERTIRVRKKVQIGNQTIFIVVDRPVSEALALAIHVLVLLVALLCLFLAAGLAGGFFFAKKIIQPVELLAETARKITAGDLNCTSTIESRNELGTLSKSFNTMTTRLTTDIIKLQKAEDALKKSREGLEEEVAKRTLELEKLLNFSNILTNTRDLQSLYNECVALSRKLLQLDFSTLMLLAKDKKSLVIQSTIGFPESTIGTFSLLQGQGLSTYVVQKKKPATVLNFHTESRFEVPPIVFSLDITSSLCVPMMIGDDVFGVFIGHTHKERVFNKDEISLYQSFANQAALAIDNASHMKNLHDSELKFRELFDNANDAILVYDLNGSILEVNKITCDRLGYSKDELLTFLPDKFIAPEFIPTMQERIRSVSENKKDIFETAHIKKSGKEIPVELNCTLIEYEGEPAILGIARDISERKKMQEELLKNRKLESVGILAGGIAHDFNNILSAIIGNLNLATMQTDPKEKTYELLRSAEKASFRARDLTRQLLTFAKGGEPVKEMTSIREVIQDSADFILRGKNIKCNYTLAEDLCSVEIDAGQISQVIQNIVINACQVMPDGGQIEIICENYQRPESDHLPMELGDYIKISIQDAGPGIPPNLLDKIFDPYFTTKEKGSGLGLAICHSIITKHGGTIVAESQDDKGATFTIYIRASCHLKLEKGQETEIETRSRKGRIMVMDDEEMVRNVSESMLDALGFDVVLAADGHEAIELYKSSASTKKVDAIIMDLTIPGGMGGKEAVKEILTFDPKAKIIVSSGYSNDPIMAHFTEYGFCAAIVKPYNLLSFTQVIDEILP